MLKLILERSKLFKSLYNRLVSAGSTGLEVVCVLSLLILSSSCSFSLKLPPISHSLPKDYLDWTRPDLSGMKRPKHSSLPSYHFGSVDEPSSDLKDSCICCRLMTDHINESGLHLIKIFEGFSSKAYRCPAGVATIGYGTTRFPDGSRVTMDSPKITEDEGKALLRGQLVRIENDIRDLVRVPLNENEFSALCSWTYNLGSGRLQSSTLRAKLNRNDKLGAANEFPKWRRAGGRIMRGLVRRRAFERRLFLTPSI